MSIYYQDDLVTLYHGDAAALGQQAIGVELDESYCEQIANRLERGSQTLDIFGGAA